MTQLPAPAQWAIRPMTEIEVAEMIERHIDYVDKNGRSVHLPMPFVRHFIKRDDELPRMVTVALLPIVLAEVRSSPWMKASTACAVLSSKFHSS
jgi:hypothetical protein